LKVPIIFAKLAALYKELKGRFDSLADRDYLPYDLIEYYPRYVVIREQLSNELPELYSDLPVRESPKEDLPGLFKKSHFESLIRDIEYILEVKANSELRFEIETEEPVSDERPARIFISHGRSPDWREVQDYVEKDLNIPTLELAQEPSKGRTVLQKLNEESNKCSFAVVVMTGDDHLGIGAPRARENVMHEIGFFQAKYGLANVCLLHEEGTNIPSNIHGLVYVPFPKGLVSATFGVLGRELRSAFANLP
jgi:predicted nucleotide-binding protein